jgi:hypothetical protein
VSLGALMITTDFGALVDLVILGFCFLFG